MCLANLTCEGTASAFRDLHLDICFLFLENILASLCSICRFSLFFQGRSNHSKLAELRKFVKAYGHNDLILTYRGIQSAVLRTSSIIHDDDTAFEVFRDGQEVGANVTTSSVIAVVPKRLVLKLIEENGGVPEEMNGVTVAGVDGILRRSLDGDFFIRHSKPGVGTPVDFPFTGETDFADVVCSTGIFTDLGSFSFIDFRCQLWQRSLFLTQISSLSTESPCF